MFLDYFVPKKSGGKMFLSMTEKDTRGVGKIKAKKVLVKNSNHLNIVRPLRGMANVKKTEVGYKLQSFSKCNISNIIKKIKAFNDIEIQYSDNLDDNDLIVKSSKPLWVLEARTDGVFTLSRYKKGQ